MANAFSNNIMNNLQNSVRTLYYRRKLVGRLTLTNEEYLQTFVPAEARDLFREVAPLIATERYNHKWTLELSGMTGNATPAINANLHMNEMPGGAMPVPRNLRLQPDAPKEIIERIYNWAINGGDTSREFGRLSRILVKLNETCSRTAIRYYWPTILAICTENDNTKFLVQELQELRKPVKLKSLPPGLAKAMRQSAETVATARLIPTDIERTEVQAGEVVIDIVSGQSYTEDFGQFYGLA